MQKLSMCKLSILGLVLLAASAVTAAVLPGKSDKKEAKFAAGSITNDSESPNDGVDSSITCTADTSPGSIILACNWTVENGVDSGTTTPTNDVTSEAGAHLTSSAHLNGDDDGNVGQDNTSDAS